LALSSDEALAQIPGELRAQMPGLGFRRDHCGRFFLFPHAMVFRGAYEVPDAELPRLVRSAHAHKVAWAHLGPALAALVVFSVALAAGARLTDADLQLSRGAYRFLPGIVFSGSFCMAAIAAALCSRLRSGSFARRNLGGLRYDRWAHRFHFDDRLGRSARAKLGGALLGVVGLVVTIYVTWTIEEFAASPPAL
jgi:hypothetical protein